MPTSWDVWSGGVAAAFVTVTRATAGDLITATVVATPTLSAVAGPFAVVPNVPAVAALQITPANIPLGATGNLTATFWDAYTNLVANGTVVTFTTTAGTFANGLATYTDTTAAGLTTAVLTAGCTPSAVTLSARAGAALTQTNASFVTPGLPASISVALQSNSVPVGGVTTPITATVRDCGNYLLGDGTPVTFGIGPIAASITPNPATTTGGLAPATLTSPQTAGSSVITATSGAAQGQATITFTPLEPYTITVVAVPSIITPTDSSNIQATVVDRYNNAVANGTTVNFAATLGTVSPASANTASGLASTVFTAGSVEGRAIVTATAGTGVWGTTAITITTGRTYVYLPLVMRNYSANKNLTVSAINASTNPAAVSVVVQNTGGAPIAETFWVILYLDPTQTITINKFWWEVGAPHGAAWSVTTTLQPGQSLTLLPQNATPPYSGYWPTSFTRGQHALWAQVDGWASAGTTGLVQETNEGDNIRGPVTFTVP
jgi:hypothetical protein